MVTDTACSLGVPVPGLPTLLTSLVLPGFLPPSLKTAGTWCDAHRSPLSCRETARDRVLHSAEPVQSLKLTLVQVEHGPGPSHVDSSDGRRRALQCDQAADRDDSDRRRGRAGPERGREDRVQARASARWLERDR